MNNLGCIRVTPAWLAESMGMPGHRIEEIRSLIDSDCYELRISGPLMPTVPEGAEVPWLTGLPTVETAA